jgi:hypothetical protein
MRGIAILTAMAFGACVPVPGYLVHREDLSAAEVPAIRESDGRLVKLRGGSFMPTIEPPYPPVVTVRGPGWRGAMWKAGLAVTIVGWALAAIGAGLGIAGFGRTTCGDLEACAPSPSVDEGNRMFYTGVVLGPVGDAMTLIGPALMIAGARQAPVELGAR